MILHPDFHSAETVVEDQRLSILRALPVQRRAGPPIVVFNSIGTRGRTPEFVATLADLHRPAIFVRDYDNAWYSGPETAERMVSTLTRLVQDGGDDAIDTLGFSMGAYPALALGARLPVRHAVALAPRFSPDPAIVKDPRPRPQMQRLSGRLVFPTLADGMARVGNGFVLHGMRGSDLCQFRRFDPPAHVDHWLLPRCDHFVVDWLRRHGQLRALVQAGLDGRRGDTTLLMQRLGALRHRSLSARLILYPTRLAGWLRAQRPGATPPR